MTDQLLLRAKMELVACAEQSHSMDQIVNFAAQWLDDWGGYADDSEDVAVSDD